MQRELVEKISLTQLFILVSAFLFGSAIVVGIGGEAKQDSWIAVIVACLLSIIPVWFYTFLLSRIPEKNLFEIMEIVLGKVISKVFILLYILYFFYVSARVLRDFGELIVGDMLVNTPIEVISITFMLFVAYILYLGLEVLGRFSEIYAPYLMGSIFAIGILLLFSRELHVKNVMPILPEGIGPVIGTVFPELITFPFGELVAFMMILPYASKVRYAGKTTIFALIVSGLILAYSSFVQIATLGPEAKLRSKFPLLTATGEISLWDFIERVDLIIIFVVMFGILVKVSIFFYGGLKGLELVFNRPYRAFIYPMAMIIAFMSIIISKNFAEHISEGISMVPWIIHFPFQFGIPLLLFPFVLWKAKVLKSEGKKR
ncbi:GerAB/ArcD/ProY family transporter [Halobacillus aidingensis]|uniref:Spore germination protein KB n=1 Tax=Halobacillus aidingensis TaxID=240303 RepID=A0A1H0IY84_HALAD|nr:endospore germination permease [Halobacillus aidingensis]SDO36425.1 spore germination protein KB [Halobacillus aidingensis]